MFHSVKLIREQKEEYMDHLFDVIYESIYRLFKMIYYSVMKEKEILKSFQKELSRIPEWNQLKVESVYNEFLSSSKCTYFPDLLKTIYVLSVKMVLLGIPAENRSKIKIKVPDSATFYHRLLIHIARDLWKRPYLFYHQVKSIEQQNHLYQFETIIRRKIRSVIRDTIPMELMVQQLSNSDILKEAEEESSDSEDEDGESSAEDDKDLSAEEKDDESSAEEEDGKSSAEASDKSDSEHDKNLSAEAEDEDEDDESLAEASEESLDSEDEEDDESSAEDEDDVSSAKEDAEEEHSESEEAKAEDDKLKFEEKHSKSEADDVSSAEADDVSDDKFLSAKEEEVRDAFKNKIDSTDEDIPIIQDSPIITKDSQIVTLYEEPKKKLIHIQELIKHKKKHSSKSKDRFF